MANNPAHIVTGTCRASYCYLNQPQENKFGGEPKYSITLLIPKTDIATKQKVDAACEAAKQRGAAELWKGQIPYGLQLPIYDGDGNMPKKGLPYGPECKGHWVLRASTKQRPDVVDTALQTILQPREIYSGMYCRAGVTFFPFDKGSVGIGCSLDNVQKLADGEPLSGGVSADEDFADAPPAYPQQQAYQPVAPAPYQTPATPGVPAYQPPVAPYQPLAPMQQPAYQQPAPQPYGYGQPPQPPMYQQQAAPMQPAIDPITGRPVGGVYYG